MILFANDGPDALTIALIVGCVIALIITLVIFLVFINYFRWWIQSKTTGAGVSMFDLLGMTFRKVSPNVIVPSTIMAVQAGMARRSKRTTSPAATSA